MITTPPNKTFFMLGLTTCLLILTAPSKPTYYTAKVRNQDISVIFDLNGVLVKNGGETKILGISKFIPYALVHGFSCKKILKKNLFDFYESIQPRSAGQALACDQDGLLLPELMCQWMRGIHSSSTILAKIEAEATTRARGLEIDLISSISRMIFSPELFIQTQHVADNSLNFVRELKRRGYKIYILSNFDSESFRLLEKKYAELFCLFDGIMISGDVGLLKPEQSLYEYFLNAYAIDRSKAFFIDDQMANVVGARSAGIESAVCPVKKGIFSNAPDIDAVRLQFYGWRGHLNHSIAVA